MNKLQVLPISVLRKDADKILKSLKEVEGYYLFSRSLPKAVILDIDKYEKSKELIEDLIDAVELEKARGEKTISWEEHLKHRYGDKN